MRTTHRWTIPGDAPIEIVRDTHGVPHVHAATEADVYRGLGHCHGVDRALQVLLVRILGQGRACERLDDSDDMLQLDRFFRRLNLAGGTADQVAQFSPRHRQLMQAYCDGLNLALQQRVPWELRVLGYRPEPWTLADLILLHRLVGYVALAQTQGDIERLLVELVQAGVSQAHLEALFPGGLADLDVELLRRVRLGERIVPDSVRWNAALPRAVASNNWAVSGRKTASGSPILANDPHLEVNRLPALWYEAVLEWDGRYCIAATMPGLSAMLLGRTPDLAWGATYTFMDATDSWVEECRDGRYRRHTGGGDQWVPFRTRTEVITRKQHPAATVTVYENDHGVLDGDPTQPGFYLTTRWATASDTGAASFTAILDLPNARTVTEGMALMGRHETAWNWVFADRDGNIGYQMSGCMPRRGRGNGLVPLPGWDPANDWLGRVPPEDLPRTMNPPAGFIVTANNDLNHLGRARPINVPMGSYRADRIAELLAARDGWTAADMQTMQMDVLSPHAQQFMAVLRPLLPPTPAAEVLRVWDCRYDLESVGAPLFEHFYRTLVAEVFGAVCGGEVLRCLLDETGILADFYANFDAVLLCADSVWFGAEGRDAVYRRVAERVLTHPAGTWAERQQLMMKHLLLGGRLPRWAGFDRGPVPLRGSRGTIHQGQIYRSGGRETSFAPSYRLVIDLAESAAYTCLAGGSSDRRFSRWYATGIADWVAGRFKRLTPDGRGSPRSP